MHVFCSEAGTNTGCDTTRLPLPHTCPGGFSPVQRAPPIGEQVSQQQRAGKIPFPQIREMFAPVKLFWWESTEAYIFRNSTHAWLEKEKSKRSDRQMTDRWLFFFFSLPYVHFRPSQTPPISTHGGTTKIEVRRWGCPERQTAKRKPDPWMFITHYHNENKISLC